MRAISPESVRARAAGVAAALVVAAALAGAPSASAHGLMAAPRASEAELLKLETGAIGRAHALEHRRARREARLLSALGRPDDVHRATAVGEPSEVGRWSLKDHIDVTGVHAILLPTGKVLFFNYGPAETGIATLWDPATEVSRRVDPPGGDNIWCAGQTQLADGRVLVAGGNIPKTGENFNGLDTIYTFDPWTEKWMFQGRMSAGRWYPTTTLLPDGRVVITSGLKGDGSGTINAEVEVFTPSPDPAVRGTIETVNPRRLNLYPFQHVVRDGRVLVSGPMREDVGLLDPAGWTFSPLQKKPAGNHYYGSAVLLPDGPTGSSKVMVIGGDDQAGTEVVDAENLGAGWVARSPLPQKRRNTNSVITPDGALITIGGNIDGNYGQPQKEALRYDPAADAWTPLAAQDEPRGYHSTALLLPDGRIVSAGDDGPGGGGGQSDEIEIFSPPYLFRGEQPAISASPGAVAYGATFGVRSPDADVARAVLVAPGATTHANDMHQRLVPLTMTRTAGGFDLTAPAAEAIAPPGYYMLFLVDSSGVPSEARFLRLARAVPAPGPGEPPPVAPAPPAAGGPGPGVLVPAAQSILAPLAPRSYWREGFENPIRGIRHSARVGSSYAGRKALWVGSGAVVPGPALIPGRYAVSMRVRNGGARMTATARGTTVAISLTAEPGPARWRPVSRVVRIGPGGPVRVRLRVAPGGWAIVDDLVLRRVR